MIEVRNPIANAGQFAAEDEVRQMWRLDIIRRARAHAGHLWKVAYGEDVPEEAAPTFEAAMDEYVANYLFKAAACDPAYPRFVRNFMGPYAWRGEEVPGARMGGDNPDNCYRLAPIAHGGRYRVRLAPTGPEPAHVSFTLVGNWGTSVTIQTLDLADLERQADGGAEITLDGEPANGRPNHLTTAPHAKFLFVRDSMSDWERETPLDLGVERLGGPDADPLPIDVKARRAAFRLIEEVPLYYWFTRLFSARPINRAEDPHPVSSVGGLVSQASCQMRLRLEPHEAAILRYDPAGAAYSSAVLYNWWFQSIDVDRRQSSLTAAMSQAGPDGSVTCVISAQDPGYRNWIDTGGLRDSLALVRWQGLPQEPLGRGPRASLEVVPFSSLQATLGARLERVDAAGRAAQLRARALAYGRRVDPNSA
jgi:hypothetical protein